jgi:hypothetical protein
VKKSYQTPLLACCLLLIGLAYGKAAYAASQTISVTGSGSNSVNTSSSSQSQTTLATQNNTAAVTNNISVKADTGHNSADSNTSSKSSISTGNIYSTLTVNNSIGSNTAGACCGSSNDPVDLLIQGNGSGSANSATTASTNENIVKQANSSTVVNSIKQIINAGRNASSNNTASGSDISTGSIFSNVLINNNLNKNAAQISCCEVLKEITSPVGQNPPTFPPNAAIIQNPEQVLSSSKVEVLPMTGAEDNLWIMSLASVVLMLGFLVRRQSSLLVARLGV